MVLFGACGISYDVVRSMWDWFIMRIHRATKGIASFYEHRKKHNEQRQIVVVLRQCLDPNVGKAKLEHRMPAKSLEAIAAPKPILSRP